MQIQYVISFWMLCIFLSLVVPYKSTPKETPPPPSVPFTTAPLCILKSSWAKGLCCLYSLMQYHCGFEIFFCIVKLKYYSILAGYQTWWGFHKQRVLVTCRRSRVSVSNDQTHTQQWHFICFTVLMDCFVSTKLVWQ